MTEVRRVVVDLVSSAQHMQLPSWAADRLRAAAPSGWEVIVINSIAKSVGSGTNQPSAESLAAVPTAEVYFGFGLSPEVIAAAPYLRWAHSVSAGITSSITPALRDSGIAFTNSAGVYAEGMADTVLAGVLHFVRGLDFAVRQQAEATWGQRPFIGGEARLRELNECRVLVVGAGGIGSAVAQRFTALGCSCVGIRRRPELGIPDGFARVTGVSMLSTEIVTTDVLVLAAPLTESSHGLVDEALLALLPPGAIVVNVARGGLIVDAALLAALDSGQVRGAVLDVFEKEPLPPEHPYWRHPSVLITPHVSGVSPRRSWARALDLFEDNWRRWAAGEPLRNVVDLDAGY